MLYMYQDVAYLLMRGCRQFRRCRNLRSTGKVLALMANDGMRSAFPPDACYDLGVIAGDILRATQQLSTPTLGSAIFSSFSTQNNSKMHSLITTLVAQSSSCASI